MLRCAILDDYQNCAFAFADWDSLPGVEITNFTQNLSPQQLAPALSGFDILVAMRERSTIDAALLEQLPRLKLLVTTGMRNSAIDIAAARERNVVVCGTRGLSYPTPELTWGLLLALMRNIPADVAGFRNGGKWQQNIGTTLYGRTLGIVGLGRIGQQIARYGQAFDMKTIAWSPNLTEARCRAAGVAYAGTLDEILQGSDVVTLHMVLSQSTRGLIGERELALMKPSAVLLNTSRGPLVDEKALIKALAEKRIGGAGLDVFDVEPLPIDHALRTLPNVVATPHIGFVSRENYEVFYGDAVEDIHAWLNGSPVRVLE